MEDKKEKQSVFAGENPHFEKWMILLIIYTDNEKECKCKQMDVHCGHLTVAVYIHSTIHVWKRRGKCAPPPNISLKITT